MKSKREITFVLKRVEIELLMEADSHFFAEFFGRTVAKRYEFTYSYEALEMLSHRIAATALIEVSKQRRRQFERLINRIELLLGLSDKIREIKAV